MDSEIISRILDGKFEKIKTGDRIPVELTDKMFGKQPQILNLIFEPNKCTYNEDGTTEMASFELELHCPECSRTFILKSTGKTTTTDLFRNKWKHTFRISEKEVPFRAGKCDFYTYNILHNFDVSNSEAFTTLNYIGPPLCPECLEKKRKELIADLKKRHLDMMEESQKRQRQKQAAEEKKEKERKLDYEFGKNLINKYLKNYDPETDGIEECEYDILKDNASRITSPDNPFLAAGKICTEEPRALSRTYLYRILVKRYEQFHAITCRITGKKLTEETRLPICREGAGIIDIINRPETIMFVDTGLLDEYDIQDITDKVRSLSDEPKKTDTDNNITTYRLTDRIKFGRYKGYTLAWIAENDAQYFNWLKKKVTDIRIII